MTSTTLHIALQVHQMGGLGSVYMATTMAKRQGNQRSILCEDASSSRSEMIDATRAREMLEGGSNRPKGKEDELQRRREQLVVHEAAIKHQEEELQAGGAALKSKSDRKKDVAEPSSGCKRKGK